MHHLIDFLIAGCLGMTVCLIAALTVMVFRKSSTESGFQIGCASGDNETMTLSYNFMKNESEASKNAKRREAYQIMADRREESHQNWLKKRDESIKENQARLEAEKEAGNVSPLVQNSVEDPTELTSHVSETR